MSENWRAPKRGAFWYVPRAYTFQKSGASGSVPRKSTGVEGGAITSPVPTRRSDHVTVAGETGKFANVPETRIGGVSKASEAIEIRPQTPSGSSSSSVPQRRSRIDAT